MARFPTPHTARLREYVEHDEDDAPWVEGEPDEASEPEYGAPFPCYLFLPLGSQDQGSANPRTRKVSRPQVMFDSTAVVGNQPGADMELMVAAPELASWAGGVEVRWQIDGEPQPFGPPGATPIGVLANLKRVSD